MDSAPKPSSTGSSRQAPHSAKSRYIMVISDDLELTETLQLELQCEGYQVSVIHDGLRGLIAVHRYQPDMVVIGWHIARLSGLEMCDRLRAYPYERPIILLTPGDNVADRIAGLKAGANDCISLPFVKAEFIARLQAQLVRTQMNTQPNTIVRCADVSLNRATREVFRGDRAIKLTAKEFDLLAYLMEHYFQVLTRSQILETVWGYDYMGSSNVIEVYIRYLRRKLESDHEPRLIHTVRSVGYILREAT